MNIYIGSDHAGFKLKEYLKKKFPEVVDLGNEKYDEKDDYPVFAYRVGKRIVKEKTRGILVCGSSEGACIAANKIKGVRAISAFSKRIAVKSREDNNANILCLSGWYLSKRNAVSIVKKWINTPFSMKPRHERRIKMIEKIERGGRL